MSQLKEFNRKFGTMKSMLTKFQNYFGPLSQRTSVTDSDLSQLQLRLDRIEPLIREYDIIVHEIEGLNETEDTEEIDGVPSELLTNRDKFEDTYFHLMAEASLFLINHAKPVSTKEVPVSNGQTAQTAQITPIAQNSDINVKLPTIQLPKFSGNCMEWLPFKEVFTSIIAENKTLSPVQKLYYLKGCLQGEAAKIVETLSLIGSNYQIAFDLLKDRFENKRVIVNNHIKALVDANETSKTAASLRNLIDTFQSNVKSLKALEVPTEHWDTILIYLLANKLDFISRKEWEQTLDEKLPTLTTLINFLSNRCRTLEALEINTQNQRGTNNANNKNSVQKTNKFPMSRFTPNYKPLPQFAANSKPVPQFVSMYKPSCAYCKKSHFISYCTEFSKLSPNARLDETTKRKLCINCLKPNHEINNCYSLINCRACNAKHHSLLHESYLKPNNPSDSVALSNLSHNSNYTQVLLSTAIVTVKRANDEYLDLRVLLDSGSTSCFITEEAQNKLGTAIHPVNVPISGISQASLRVRHATTIHLKSKFSNFNTKVNCLILKEITRNVPLFSFEQSQLQLPNHIPLADPEFFLSRPVDLLLGAEIFWQLIGNETLTLGKNCPQLQNTELGWVIGGPLSIKQPSSSLCFLATAENNVDDLLKSFWEIEEYTSKPRVTMSEEDKYCETQFETTHSRDSTGRFIVKLPLKDNLTDLGNNRAQALHRFSHLEKKFTNNPTLQKEYQSFMTEYITLGHMESIEGENVLPPVFYLPHHPVIREESQTSKLRVVFDGSAKSSKSLSINNVSMKGPTLQTDLIDVLLRFRMYNYVFSADISKMYRQIWVHPDDRNFQLILWRFNSSEPVKTYRLKTVTYGLASSPFLAIRCLHQLANDHSDQYRLAHEAIKQEVYVDDFLCGGSTIEETIKKRNEIVGLLKKAQFELRKWSSNDLTILPENNANHEIKTFYSATENTKVLGITWNPKIDKFIYKTNYLESSQIVTKRIILSTTAKIFDPLGLVGPILIRPKLIMQQLWLLQIEWDKPVPENIRSSWIDFLNQFNQLREIQIPRALSMAPGETAYELHGFCDSSQFAYGACIYLRSVNDKGTINVRLMCAKSRVAPIKTISLPRLELCGAVLLSRLVHRVNAALSKYKFSIYCWTDSQIVLAWIRGIPANWKTFVANRASEIQSNTKVSSWRHVSTKENPADLISRGSTVPEIINNQLWWEGPHWLHYQSKNWPSQTESDVRNVPEQRQLNFVVTPTEKWEILTRFSSLTRLQRTIAYCLRFYKIVKLKSSITGPLSSEELQESLLKIVSSVQRETFNDYIVKPNRKQDIPNHRLAPLNPFIDKDNILRVGGRINQADISYNSQHQIILPADHYVTRLFIMNEHIRILHGGQQATLYSLRRQFWPIGGIRTVRKILRQCHKCFRVNPKPMNQLMGNLPKSRVIPARPFINTGMDYGGPIFVRQGKGRGKRCIKTYIALFICCSTKAIHIELASDLTTETFISTLKRFISRRGHVENLYCDNATNFKGARNELNNIFNMVNSEPFQSKVQQYCVNENIKFHFIPPNSPHMGGLWEAGIKSIKTHIKRTIGNASLTFEEMYTLLVQIEACINSRPLTPISNDPNDLSVLSPSHFLIGDQLTAPLELDLKPLAINRLSRWQFIEKLRQHFWQRWVNEYLNTLQQRYKWKRKMENIDVGTLVIIKEDNLPPLVWPIGRIQEVHAGSDGIVRVVSVKTAKGVIKRAISRLCILPISN